ncbi:MAG: DUF3696 domain-containing protein [Hormoscilla sp.]
MLREYQLTNFKAFAGPEKLPIRPITLIYGPNSSGKSSVLQSLLLLKQTLQEAEDPDTVLLPKGNLVNLGSYREFVHRHDVSQSFSFKVKLELEERQLQEDFGKIVPKDFELAPILELQVAFAYDKEESNVVLSSIELFLGDDPSSLICYRHLEQNDIADESETFQKTTLKRDLINYEQKIWLIWYERVKEVIYKNREEEVDRRFIKFGLHENRKGWKKRLPEELFDCEKEFEDKLRKNWYQEKEIEKRYVEKVLFSIKSLIRLWEHFEDYSWDQAKEDLSKLSTEPYLYCRGFLPVRSDDQDLEESKPSEEVWKLSDVYKPKNPPNISDLTILASEVCRSLFEEMTYIGPLREYPERIYTFSGNTGKQVGKSGKMVPDILFKNPELLQRVNDRLKSFDLKYEFKVAKFTNAETGEMSDIFALQLVDEYTGVNVSLQDVGFGISQVLPIIVQSMLSRNTTLLFEQPEIHIHPRLQAELGSLLAECIKAPINNQFIIETHSEHLMLRLQKLIRKKELKPEDISVIYVDRGAEGSKCLSLRLDKEGDFIDEWPDGFFEEDFNEIFG